jgi:hypothetical protein
VRQNPLTEHLAKKYPNSAMAVIGVILGGCGSNRAAAAVSMMQTIGPQVLQEDVAESDAGH